MKYQTILYIGAGGAAGTLLRYGLFEWLPWTSIWITLLCNMLGAFVLAYLYRYIALSVKSLLTEKLRLGFGVGLLGGFTTFSTISLDLAKLIHDKAMLIFIIYLLATFIGGFMSTLLGFQLANKSIRGAA